MLYVCIEYHIYVNMYHVSAQGVDERMINVHYYYYASHMTIACCRTCLDFFNSDLIEAREEQFTGLSLRLFFRQISMSQCLSRH